MCVIVGQIAFSHCCLKPRCLSLSLPPPLHTHTGFSMNISSDSQKLWQQIIKLFRSQRYKYIYLFFNIFSVTKEGRYFRGTGTLKADDFEKLPGCRFTWRKLPGLLHSPRLRASMHTRRHEIKSSVYCGCVPPSWISSVSPTRILSLEQTTLFPCSSLSLLGWVCSLFFPFYYHNVISSTLIVRI